VILTADRQLASVVSGFGLDNYFEASFLPYATGFYTLAGFEIHSVTISHVQCLARKIWRNLLKSRRPTKILQVTSLDSGVQNGFKRMNLKK
jgi:hypothetical protein